MEAHRARKSFGSFPGVHPPCGSGEAQEFAHYDEKNDFGFKVIRCEGVRGEG